MSEMEILQQLWFVRQHLDYLVNAIHDSGRLLEIHFIEGVTRGVVVGIPKYCRVSNHDGWVVLLPERPLV